MKIIITQTDLQQAIVAHLAQFNIHVSAEQLSIDLDDIEINLNPDDTGSTTSRNEGNTSGIKRRTRRSKEQIEADAKAEANVGYASPEAQAASEAVPAVTHVAPVYVNPFAGIASEPKTTEPVLTDSLDEDVELVEKTPFIETKTKAEPISIFG